MVGPQMQKPRAQEQERRAQGLRAQERERHMAMWEEWALPTGLPPAPTISGSPARKTLRS